MKKARVAIFEDNALISECLLEALTGAEHEIVLHAPTMAAARLAIEQLTPEELDVAVIDGNLDKGQISGQNGNEIATALRANLGDIMLIGFAASGDVEGVDVNVRKDIMGVVRSIDEQ